MASDLTHWSPRPRPARQLLAGQRIRLEPLDPDRHAAGLYRAAQGPSADPELWTYMSAGPFTDEPSMRSWLLSRAPLEDPLTYALVDPATGTPHGMASFMRVEPAHGVIEIGWIWFGPALQRTPAATEAIYLLARHAFDDLGYRRLEWKCDAANARSRRAALRFGFAYEGLFRQHLIVKGRNRDTAWFSIIDAEWAKIRQAFEAWLAPSNFGAAGHQRRTLESFRE